MSTLDAGFYFVEHENVPMHLGALAVFEGPAPSYQELAGLFASKLPHVPRYRQVVRTAPLQVLRPAWAEDEHFDIGHHLRHAMVPKPGDARQLRRLAGRIYAQPLDRGRPLWEAWLLQGLPAGRWAILNKVHHCMVDGIGGSDLLAEIFDLDPDGGPPVQPSGGELQPESSPEGNMAVSIADVITWPLRLLAGLPGLVLQQLPAQASLVAFARGLTRSAQRLAVPSAASLNGPIGPRRLWDWATASLSQVKEIRGELGGTVNDVLLAAITRGFRDLLIERGELSDGLVVRSLVPISVRAADERGVTTNRLSAVLANLPVAEADPIQRLRLVRDQMDEIKHTYQAAGAELLTQILGLAPPTLLELGARAAFQLPQPLVQTVTTNVPGPQFPLYVLGRQMTEAHPYVPIGGNVRIAIAIFSYLGRFSFGITADSSAAADLDILAQGIRRGLAELQAPSRASRPAAAAGR
ncbi:MAG TPA: wax ester/triacylglycerol synthase family O-acyltransferase [Streptosporangiaceae bacterium]|nr:wax ester/triacylglycerol synthase family O-acyltransferase [Streptosporangiaceae bacterium]